MNEIKIYSKSKNDWGKHFLLHKVFTKLSSIKEERTDLVEPEEFIQCSLLKMNKGKTFRPHKHIWKSLSSPMVIAQESCFVVKGRVKAFFYDFDDELLQTVEMTSGDVSFTFKGGHTYEILEDGTQVMEYKTGPYEGVEKDKTFLKE